MHLLFRLTDEILRQGIYACLLIRYLAGMFIIMRRFMFPSDRYYGAMILVSGFFMMFTVLPVHAAMDARFELDPRTFGDSATAKKPLESGRQPHDHRKAKSSSASEGKNTSRSGGQFLRLEPPNAKESEQVANDQFRQFWDKMLPPSADQKSITLQSSLYSLTFDPQRYPVYAAMNNGRILVDKNVSIPPLVEALISEKDPSIRIVSESPHNRKLFLSAMFNSAGFYSVEENFIMDFGSDPKLTIHSDFRIEKTPESIFNQDILLVNAGLNSFSKVIREFLKNEGYMLQEPFASPQPVTFTNNLLLQETSKIQSEIIDTLLSSISVVPDKDRSLEVFAADDIGISLSVKAERYFEHEGRRYIVSSFDGDPVTYTLYRILETKGYRVVILEAKDDFRKVSEKLLNGLRIPAMYAQHEINFAQKTHYSLHMTGFKYENPNDPGAGIFVTNLELDRVILDLFSENGYSIVIK